MPRHSIALLSMGLLVVGTACGTGPDLTEDVNETHDLADRSAYSEVELPAEAEVVGVDPNQMALDLFGMQEPVEGNFSETVVMVVESDDDAIVELTQTGLPDDSVEGQLYRLDFVPVGNEWQLDWAGEQWRCREDRGPQEWTTERCL